MKTVDARGLQHHLGRYLDDVERGEVLEVRRRRKVIARIVPFTDDAPAEPWPDVVKRLDDLYPDGALDTVGSDQIARDRDGR